MYQRILVPVDGTPTSKAGLQEAIALARQCQATVRLLHVVDDFPSMTEFSTGMDFEQYTEGLRQHGRKTLEDGSRLVTSAGLAAETQLEHLKGGRVSQVILKDVKASGCDLIVIGTHGRRGIQRALLGSDAEDVLRASPVPVLLVRSPEKAK